MSGMTFGEPEAGLLWDAAIEAAYDCLATYAELQRTLGGVEFRNEITHRTGIPLEPEDPLTSSLLESVGRRSFLDTGTLVIVVVEDVTAERTAVLLARDLDLVSPGLGESEWLSEHRSAVFEAFSYDQRLARWMDLMSSPLNGEGMAQNSRDLVGLSVQLQHSAYVMRRLAKAPAPAAATPTIGRCHCRSGLRLVAQPLSNGVSELRIECIADPGNHKWVLPL
jgi:hypothetical protein